MRQIHVKLAKTQLPPVPPFMTPTPPAGLWYEPESARWESVLAEYESVIARQGVPPLLSHDAWYRHELPPLLHSRRESFVTHAELVRLTEWKMTRGVWRARNLMLVRSNTANDVQSASLDGLALIPHPTHPAARIAKLAGVGPATASAVLSAYAPRDYPFLDELVAAQVPELGAPAFTLSYYQRYASALRERASALGGAWTCTDVERALWAHVGGKAGLAGGAG